MRRDEALRLLAEHRAELDGMGVKSLALFGSVARDEAGPESDIDVLVDIRRPMGLFGFSAIHLRLEEIFGCRVDLVTEAGMRPRYYERIVRDLVHVGQ
jgi:predicted nucleotidyltransferase